MAEYNSALPIRSEADGTDERVHSKIVDYADPSQGMEVDADKNAHVEVHGNAPDGSTDKILRLSESGHANGNGDYDLTTNSDPDSSGLIAHDRGATIDRTSQNKRVTAIPGEGDSVCLDVALHDEAGQFYDDQNPLPVTVSEGEGEEVHEFDEAENIIKDANDDWDYSVADGDELLIYGVLGSGSGKMRMELQIGDGEAAEVFTTKMVTFNSTADPQCNMDFYRVPLKVVGTVNTTTVKIIKRNRDNQNQDLHSLLIGYIKL